jgi:predicted ATPase
MPVFVLRVRGSGEISLKLALKKFGYLCKAEAATEIIETGLTSGISHPWILDDYHINMYKLIRDRQREAQSSSEPVVFFDRDHLD